MQSPKFSIVEIIPNFLQQNQGKLFSAQELAQWIFENHPDGCREKFERSKNKKIKVLEDIVDQIRSEVGSIFNSQNKKWQFVRRIKEGKNVYRYFYDATLIPHCAPPANLENTHPQKLLEKDLYPLLTQYVQNHLNVFLRRIDEKRSANSHGAGGNHWLYPDMVGLEDLSRDWHEQVRQCVKECAARRTRMWSFEVKREISRANVRECFFQTLSNSSWAHYAYLVAAEITGGDGTMRELQILCAAHGVGFIRLNVDNLDNSKILIAAREKENIDWAMVNRLACENNDFLNYVKLVRQFHQINEIPSLLSTHQL